MPKSKRTKMVSLTKTKPKAQGLKEKTLQKLEAAFKKYNNLHVLHPTNLTAENQKLMGNELPGALIFGKKSLMRYFFSSQLDKHPQLEVIVGLLDTPELKEVCLLFSNSPWNKVSEALKVLHGPEFANPNTNAVATVVLTAGDQVFDKISTTNDAYLRTMGLFVTVQNGKLFLQENFVAAQKGKPLTVVQSKVLKMLGIKVGHFSVSCHGVYDKALGIATVNPK